MSLTNGFVALTTPDERKELGCIRPFGSEWTSRNHNPRCTENHPRVVFAFWQKDFQGGKVAYWHVLHNSPFHHSTLSMQGLKEYRLL